MDISRRTFLKTSAAAGTAAVAGCMGILGGDSSISMRNWLYEPGTVADVDHYPAVNYAPAAIEEREGNFDDDLYALLEGFGSDARDRVDLDFDETTAQLSFGPNSVLRGEFEASDVADTLEDDDYSSEDAYNDFDVYVGPDEDAAVGIDENALVVARSTGIFGSADNAESILEAILDVNAGDAESYGEDSEDLATLVDAFDGGSFRSARTHDAYDSTDTDDGRFAGEVAVGLDSRLVDDGIETTFVRVFNEASDIDEGDVEDWVDDNQDGTFEDFDDVQIDTNGRVVRVTGTEATGDYQLYVGSA